MTLKVLSIEMDVAEVGSFERPLLKREARRFLEKSARPPHPVRALLRLRATS